MLLRIPDRYQSLVACCVLQFSASGLQYSFGVFQAHYHLHTFPREKTSIIALIGAVGASSALILSLFVGHFIARYGARKLSFCFAFCWLFSLIGASFSVTVPQLIITQGVLQGLAAGGLFMPAATVFLPFWEESRSLAVGLNNASLLLGATILSLITEALLKSVDYQWTLRIIGLITFALQIASIFSWKEEKIERVKDRNHMTLVTICAKAIRHKPFVLFYLASLIGMFGYVVPLTYLASYAEEVAHTTAKIGSALNAVLNIGGIVGRIVTGAAADRFGASAVFTTVFIVSGILPLAIWLPAHANLAAIFIFAFTFGAFAFSWIGLVPSLMNDLFPIHLVAPYVGLFITNELPGTIAATPIAGLLIRNTGEGRKDYTFAIVFTGLTLTVGAFFSALATCELRRTQRRETLSVEITERIGVSESAKTL